MLKVLNIIEYRQAFNTFENNIKTIILIKFSENE